MHITVTLFPLFSFVQNKLDAGADDIYRTGGYEACLRLEPPNDPAKKAVRFVKSTLFGLPRPTTFCRLVLKNSDLQPE
jgi:hypothetical protein